MLIDSEKLRLFLNEQREENNKPPIVESCEWEDMTAGVDMMLDELEEWLVIQETLERR